MSTFVLNAQLVSRRGAFALDATLQAPAGATVVLVGESGSGKTTILRMLAGLVRPDAGRMVLGADVWADSTSGIWRRAAERDVGWVPQDQALFPHLSAVDNVAFGLRAAGSSARGAVATAREMLERMGAGPEAQHRPGQLSGGQRQRVALARALVLRPRLLLLDEPLSALDPGARHGIRGTLKAILAEQPATTVYVTHSPLEALAFGERIAVLEAGRVVQEGSAGELLRRPRSSLIAGFIGTNFFRGTVARRRDDGLVDIRTSLGALTTVDPGGQDDVFVAVSPREITLSREAPSGSAQNVFRGQVTELAPEPPLGERVRVAIASEPPLVAEVTAHAAGELGLEPGVQVYAAFKATGVVPYR